MPGSNEGNDNNGNQNNTNNTNRTGDIQRVTLKIPPFWYDSPEIWFAQIEAQFTISSTTTDISKFNTVVGAIESKILTQVSDAVLKPPAQGKYENLKQQIIARFADTEHKKMSKLLSDMALGDKKPSHLLNEMRRLGGDNINEDFLKTLWLQNLPSHARAILSTSNADLTNLSALADKILEVADASQVNNINSQSTSNTSSTSNTVLERSICKLIQTLEQFNNRKGRSRTRSASRQRSSTPAGNTTKKAYDTCWYHHRFGEEAKKCVKPCNFNQKN